MRLEQKENTREESMKSSLQSGLFLAHQSGLLFSFSELIPKDDVDVPPTPEMRPIVR